MSYGDKRFLGGQKGIADWAPAFWAKHLQGCSGQGARAISAKPVVRIAVRAAFGKRGSRPDMEAEGLMRRQGPIRWPQGRRREGHTQAEGRFVWPHNTPRPRCPRFRRTHWPASLGFVCRSSFSRK
jgi:hypothetical protein